MNAALPRYKASSWSLFPARFTLLLCFATLFLVVLPIARPFFTPEYEGVYLGFIPYILFVVCLTADTARSIVSRPFSYTLPGHMASVRRHLLLIGVVSNALFIAPMLLYPVAGLMAKAQAILGVYLAGLALYFGATLLVFRVIGAGLWASMLFVLVIVLAKSEYAMNPRVFGVAPQAPAAEYFNTVSLLITQNPVPVAVLAALLLVRFWQLFSQRDVSRQLLGRDEPGFADRLDYKMAMEHKTVQLTEQRRRANAGGSKRSSLLSARWIHPGTGKLFCLRHQGVLALRRFEVLLTSIKLWQQLGFVLVMMVAMRATGTASHYGLIMMFSCCLMLFLNQQPIERHSPFLPYQRRDLAATSFLIGLGNSLYCAFVALLFWPISVLAALPLVQDLSSLIALAFSWIFAPYCLTLKLWKRNWQDAGGNLIIFMMIVAVVLLYSRYFDAYTQASAATLIAVHLSGWLIYAAAVYWRYVEWDLD